MKKILLSFFVVFSFILYSWHERNEAAEVHVVPAKSSPVTNTQSGTYRDGEYTGSVEDAFYGNIEVKAIIAGGRLADVQFLQHPNDRDTSIEINNQAMPILRQEAIQAQSAEVDIVSGATDTAEAFRRSLGDALRKAS